MKNCIVKIIDNVFEKMTKVGYFLEYLLKYSTTKGTFTFDSCWRLLINTYIHILISRDAVFDVWNIK